MHFKPFLRSALFILATLVVMSAVLYVAARYVVGQSGFRLAVGVAGANRFAGQTLDVLVGNSQLMDGLNASDLNRKHGLNVFNLAFNNVQSPEVLALAETFLRNCNCKVRTLYVNAGALEDEEPGTSDTEVFVAAFNPELARSILDDQKSRKFSLSFLPALFFNNEMFHRAAYQWLRGTDDQAHGNDYRLRLPSIPQNRLGGVAKRARIDEARLRRLVDVTQRSGTRIVALIAPLHPLYVANRQGFAEYKSEASAILHRYGIPLLDHSSGIVNDYDSFADLTHMNRGGQRQYTEYFAKYVEHAK